LAGVFASTHWSVVLAAGETKSAQADEAMDRLCRSYWYPLYAYVRRKGYGADEAQDLTCFQSFLPRPHAAMSGWRPQVLAANTPLQFFFKLLSNIFSPEIESRFSVTLAP